MPSSTGRPRKKTAAEQAEEILADRTINDELKRKLSYVQEELQRRQGEQFLIDRRKELITEAQRRVRFAP